MSVGYNYALQTFSRIRAKKPTYVPALVAITRLRLLVSKNADYSSRGARLQGLHEWLILCQSGPQSYKQLGNGVNVGAVYNVIRAQVLRDIDLLEKKPA